MAVPIESFAESTPPRGHEDIHPVLFDLAKRELDDHAVLLDQIDRVFARLGAEELFASEESRISYIDQMDPETFVATLSWLNGMITGTPTGERHPSDEIIISSSSDIETGTTEISDVFPAPEDRLEMLGDLLTLAQSVPDLELKATILGYGISAIHGFERANGRLARMVFYLLAEGYRPNDETLRTLLSENGRKFIRTDSREVREILLERIRLETIAYIIEDGEPVPALILETVSGPRNLKRVFEKGRPEATDQDRVVFQLLTRTPYREILPTAAGRLRDNETTLDCVEERGNRVYFALDRFWRIASREDMELYYELYRQTAKARVEAFLGLVSGTRKGLRINIIGENGRGSRRVPAATYLRESIRLREPEGFH